MRVRLRGFGWCGFAAVDIHPGLRGRRWMLGEMACARNEGCLVIVAPDYRAATVRDLPLAVELRARMMEELNGVSPDANGSDWRTRFAEFFRRRIEDGSGVLLLALRGSMPIGVAAVYLPVTHRTEIFLQRAAYVTTVYVEPDSRRTGVASQLMRLAMQWAKERGCVVVRLRPSSIGKPLYDSLGFEPSGELELRLR
jgi:GNAT superfamily N-acetyltransferase